MANESVNATAIIGLLVGFLVVGVIGVYVGDQMIAATDLQSTGIDTTSDASAGTVNTTIGVLTPGGADTTSIDLYLVGGGGGGGAGNSSGLGYGGGAGAAGAEASYTSIAVTAATLFNYTVGQYGNGTTNASGTAGGATIVYVAGVQYLAAGGAGGGNGTYTPNINGKAGNAGYGTSHESIVGSDGTGVGAGTGGAAAAGVGAGGGGGGATVIQLVQHGGTGGRGEHGSVQITTYTATSHDTSPLATSQQSVVDTFALGVTLCKILVIVSVASIVFMLLQRTGLIPKFGGGDEGM